jgi:hypothetical protein
VLTKFLCFLLVSLGTGVYSLGRPPLQSHLNIDYFAQFLLSTQSVYSGKLLTWFSKIGPCDHMVFPDLS